MIRGESIANPPLILMHGGLSRGIAAAANVCKPLDDGGGGGAP
jgi:hypothetical protein